MQSGDISSLTWFKLLAKQLSAEQNLSVLQIHPGGELLTGHPAAASGAQLRAPLQMTPPLRSATAHKSACHGLRTRR